MIAADLKEYTLIYFYYICTQNEICAKYDKDTH